MCTEHADRLTLNTEGGGRENEKESGRESGKEKRKKKKGGKIILRSRLDTKWTGREQTDRTGATMAREGRTGRYVGALDIGE